MGMFDYVAFEMECPKCGAKVTGFQTKSTECILATVSPVLAHNFYSSCDECGVWIEFTQEKRDPTEIPVTLTVGAKGGS